MTSRIARVFSQSFSSRLVMNAALIIAAGAGCAGRIDDGELAIEQSDSLRAPAKSSAKHPVTYTGFTITDGKLGDWEFHNASVYLRFDGDTSDVQLFQPAVDPSDPSATVDTYINTNGKASITVVSGSKIVKAKFAANQIFVSVDLGDTGSTHYGARGVGFGSFSATAPGGIEPAYPLGIEDGVVDWGDIVEDGSTGIASPALSALPLDLKSNVALSGKAWECVGFPDETCPTPTTPLETDHGDLYLYQPYEYLYTPDPGGQPLTAGYFVVDSSPGKQNDVHAAALAADRCNKSPTSITYNAYVIADVSLGRHHFQNAEVYLSFDADTSDVFPFTQGAAQGFMNSVGEAHVKIISGGRLYKADFDSDQLYVFYDVAQSFLGFGSQAGGFGYPLGLTSNDQDSLTEFSSVGAIAALAAGNVAPGTYSPATSALSTDLTNATAVSGVASSCASLDPTTTTCTNLTPVALRTNKGDFLLYEPYTADDTSTGGTAPHSINWGTFWTNIGGQ